MIVILRCSVNLKLGFCREEVAPVYSGIKNAACRQAKHRPRRTCPSNQAALRSADQGDLRMLTYAIEIGLVLIGLAMALNLWRLLRGPDATDRIAPHQRQAQRRLGKSAISNQAGIGVLRVANHFCAHHHVPAVSVQKFISFINRQIDILAS